MRVTAASRHEVSIELSETEANFIAEALSSYPLVSNENRELTKSSDSAMLAEATDLLRGSLDDWTQQTRTRLQDWLNAPGTLSRSEKDWRLRISSDDSEWLLPVLNDLRVGSWHQLKCPDQEALQQLTLSPEVIRPLWTMELTGILQSILLRNF